MRLERTSGVLLLVAGIGIAAAAAQAPKAAAAPPRAPVQQPPKKSDGLVPEHKILEKFIGHWKSSIHPDRADDAAIAGDAQGTAEGKSQLGGMFAELAQTAVVNKQPYEGTITFGFDPVINKFTAIKTDSTSPAFISFVGTYDAAKKEMTMEARYSEQGTHRYVASKLVVTFPDADSIVMDEFMARPAGGSPVHTKTITYKRG